MSRWKVQPNGHSGAFNLLWFSDREDDDAPEYAANVRFDGCIHLNRYYNGKTDDENSDYLHICSIDELIEVLQELKAESIKYFGPNWNK